MADRMLIPADPVRAGAKPPGRIKSSVLRWLGVEITARDGDFWRAWHSNSDSGTVVTADAALQISAVWACVRLISQTIATLPLFLYKRDANDRRVLARDHDLFAMLHSTPNPTSTAVVFWESVVASLLLRGTAIVEQKRFKGTTRALKFLPIDRVKVPTSSSEMQKRMKASH